jgi:hypothetical protein
VLNAGGLTAKVLTMKSRGLKKVFILTCLLVFFLVIVQSWNDYVLYNPCYFTDLLTLIASDNFLDHGFVKLRFLPVFDPQPSPENITFYTHYPPLPVIFTTLLMKIGIRSLPLLRLFPILAGGLSLVFWFKLARLIADERAAYFSGLYIVTSSLFTKWLPSLFCYSYDFLLVSIALYAFVSGCLSSSSRRQKGYLAACWVCTFIQSLVSFEFILFLQIFYFGYFWLFRPKLPRSFLFASPLAPLAGLGLHLFQNFLAIGPAAITDFADAFRARTQGFASENSFGILKYLKVLVLRIFRWYGLLPIALVSWLCFYPFMDKTIKTSADTQCFKILLLLFVSGAAWFTVFMQHSFVHYHELRQWLPFYGIGASFLLSGLFSRLRHTETKPEKSWIMVLLLVLIIDHGARFAYGFLNEPRILHGLSTFNYIKETTSTRSNIFTNYAYDTHCSYYSDRNCYPVMDILAWKKTLPRKGDVFLFATEGRGAFLTEHVPFLSYLSKWALHKAYVQGDYSADEKRKAFLGDPLFQHLVSTFPFKVFDGFYIFYLGEHV